jgi:hypothetical protein
MMSERLDFSQPSTVIPFPTHKLRTLEDEEPVLRASELRAETPVFDKLIRQGKELDRRSTYPCHFDYDMYRRLEARFACRPIRGGIIMKTAFRLVNSHATCQQCLYAFEIDTYGRGGVHDYLSMSLTCIN